MNTEKPDGVFLTTRQVQARYGGVSHMWVERRALDPKFPRAVKIGRLRFWPLAELEAYERTCVMRRPASAA